MLAASLSQTAAAIRLGRSLAVFLFLLAFGKKGLCSLGPVGKDAPLEVTPGGEPPPRANSLLPGSVPVLAAISRGGMGGALLLSLHIFFADFCLFVCF